MFAVVALGQFAREKRGDFALFGGRVRLINLLDAQRNMAFRPLFGHDASVFVEIILIFFRGEDPEFDVFSEFFKDRFLKVVQVDRADHAILNRFAAIVARAAFFNFRQRAQTRLIEFRQLVRFEFRFVRRVDFFQNLPTPRFVVKSFGKTVFRDARVRLTLGVELVFEFQERVGKFELFRKIRGFRLHNQSRFV